MTAVGWFDVLGHLAIAVLWAMPFYDEERLIPSGKLVDIPEAG